jgi:signal transduction histidine kinase
LGLEGMQERIKALGGKIKITSAHGAGTMVDVQVPLPEEEMHD